MKNIEQILKDAGIELTEEQVKAINDAVSENYKTIADYNKQVKKVETAEEKLTALQAQSNDANNTIKELEAQVKELGDVDAEALNNQIAEYKERAEKAEAEAKKQILRRDQSDYLKAKFDEIGIKSERTRKSLADEIMGDDGLKWKNGEFMGLDDFLKSENEKDHFYETQEEKDAAAKQKEAEANRVKTTPAFTTEMKNVNTGADKPTVPDVPEVF